MNVAAYRQFVSPPLYLQGMGILSELASLTGTLGERALVVTDPGVEEILGTRLRLLLGNAVPFLLLRSEITPAALKLLVTQAQPHHANVVLGIGGGKAIDAGKAVACDTGARFISVPTIASNDAPTSRAIALYGDEDRRFMVETLARNPDAVLVDTEVIAGAPPQFLRWGIGDALAKAVEAEGCASSPQGRTPLGARPCVAGLALARACCETLHRHAIHALRLAGSGAPDAAFEAVVEAVILMSGLGFENGGLSIAHAMTRGLMLAPRTRSRAHGEHVAYGLLVQLALDADDESLALERDFVRSVGLPAALVDFDASQIEGDEIHFLAEKAMTAPGHILNYRRALDAQDLERAITRLEAMT